jgi:AcrR family transcriptional regulator
MSVRAARRAAAREAILAAAHAQVAEGGFASAPVTAVAARAGVATGSIYRHFPSKSDLFAEVFHGAARREQAVVGAIARDASRPHAERLAASVEAFARRALAAPTLVRALMVEPVDPVVEAARLQSKRDWRALFAALLEDGARAGAWPALDAPVAAAAIVGAMQEALAAAAEQETAGPDALVASLVTFVLHAVHANAEEETPPWPPSSAPAARARPTRSSTRSRPPTG